MKDNGYVVLYDYPAKDQNPTTFAACIYDGDMDEVNLKKAKLHAKLFNKGELDVTNVRVCRLIEIEQ